MTGPPRPLGAVRAKGQAGGDARHRCRAQARAPFALPDKQKLPKCAHAPPTFPCSAPQSPAAARESLALTQPPPHAGTLPPRRHHLGPAPRRHRS